MKSFAGALPVASPDNRSDERVSLENLPSEAPVNMPVQSFEKLPILGRKVVTSPGDIGERRLLLFLGTFTTGLLAATEMARPLKHNGTPFDLLMFLLFFSLFCWISFGFLNALAGFINLATRRKTSLAPGGATPMPSKRTAVLVPIYNEDVSQVFGRIRKMARMIEETGAGKLFDFFILSDSHADREADEYLAYTDLLKASPVPVYYRRRTKNVARKPGNIAEWVRRFGGAYDYMIVLDADSLMTGKAMAQLASLMDRNPGVGLIQTNPSVINSKTLFARWQQFAGAAYGPIASAGLSWWSGTEATFWGHNAIVRVRAFAESCGLPELKGREPRGGHIMSHDMVEAALLRRRGWAVHMVALPEGSYEEFPPTLTDFAIRDRRWCQGNLQHLFLLNSAGFHWVSRFQLLMGASAYLTSPLWLVLTLVALLHMLGFDSAPSFIPSGWPLVLTIILLLGPKLLSVAWLAMDRDRLHMLGGWKRVIRSMVFEIPLSMIVAPLTMLTQTIAVVQVLRGRASGWSAQNRESDGVPLKQAIHDYRWAVAGGIFFLAATLASAETTIWLLPIIVGLMLSPFVVAFTSRATVGNWLARRGIFTTPEDEAPAVPAEAQPARVVMRQKLAWGNGHLVDAPSFA